MDWDFGYGQTTNGNGAGSDTNNGGGNGNQEEITNITTGGIDHDKNGIPADDIDVHGNGGNGDGNGNSDKPDENGNKDNKDKSNPDDKDDVNLEVGSTVQVEDKTYTVDKDGNLVDEEGKIFKEAKDVKDWIKSFDKVEDEEEIISIDSIRKAIGIDITDDNDKSIEFENTVEGIKAYVDAVIETAREEHYETAINTLYQRYPVLNDVLNYYIANGNSLEGFGEIPDRSGITIDDSNEAQQEAIIKAAWTEQGRKGDVESYIQYLKSSGILLATAKEELAGLQEADKQYREQLEAEAEKKEQERIKELQEYWNGVHEVVKSRQIAGYQIPENIIINRNGQKLSVTPEDFFNYLYRVDENGMSAYNRDLAAQSRESRRDDEILRAYLMFVGGNYSNLVNMAINKEKVATLKLRAKERNTTTVRINKPKPNNNSTNIDLGYN